MKPILKLLLKNCDSPPKWARDLCKVTTFRLNLKIVSFALFTYFGA